MFRILCIILAASLVIASKTPFYRRDYKYFDDYEAFYKLHEDQGYSFPAAVLACQDEGAQLFYPNSTEEWTVVKNLAQSTKIQQDMTFIYVGIHNTFGMEELITVDGRPTPLPIPDSNDRHTLESNNCVFMKTDDGSLIIENCEEAQRTRPFVCKKKISHNPCPNVDPGYKFQKETKKCYKFNMQPKSWNAAMETCFMEGGSLLIVKNSEESDIIRRLNNQLSFDQTRYFVGFRKLYNDKLYTVKGNRIIDGFYTRLSEREDMENKDSDCGVIYLDNSNLYVNTNPCVNSLPFICEIDV